MVEANEQNFETQKNDHRHLPNDRLLLVVSDETVHGSVWGFGQNIWAKTNK
jgi:hypothetical protein